MHTFIIAALTADGFIAKDKAHLSTKWTSKEDAQFFSERTKKAGVIVMGRSTFETIGRPLPGRLTIVYSSQPKPIELEKYDDSQLRFTNLAPAELLKQLATEGFVEVAICGGASIYTQFMKAGVVDTAYLTVEPVIFGSGIKLFSEPLDNELVFQKLHQLSEQTVVLEYSVSQAAT